MAIVFIFTLFLHQSLAPFNWQATPQKEHSFAAKPAKAMLRPNQRCVMEGQQTDWKFLRKHNLWHILASVGHAFFAKKKFPSEIQCTDCTRKSSHNNLFASKGRTVFFSRRGSHWSRWLYSHLQFFLDYTSFQANQERKDGGITASFLSDI